MKTEGGLRNDAIAKALDQALATGKTEALYKQLVLVSGLPGPRANLALAQGFATALAAHGAKGTKLAQQMASLEADIAPGATELEFLPMCGVLALGALAADDAKARAKTLPFFQGTAEDLRFRVREATYLALARIGEKVGDVLVFELAPYMDGFFQAAAVLQALAEPGFLNATHDPEPIVERLHEAFELADRAARSASRYPGRKALVEVLGKAPGAIAARHGAVILDEVTSWAKTVQPELREAIELTIKTPKLQGRYDDATRKVRDALTASAPVPRDPTIIVHGTRGRAKKKGRGR